MKKLRLTVKNVVDEASMKPFEKKLFDGFKHFSIGGTDEEIIEKSTLNTIALLAKARSAGCDDEEESMRDYIKLYSKKFNVRL